MTKYIYLWLFLGIFCLAFSQNQTDANGKKQGYWKKKDEKSNKLIYEGLFKDDKPQGLFKYYYPHDTVRALTNFKLDGKMAYSTLFHPNGKKMASGKYIGEEKDSVWNYFDESGTLISKENYIVGKKDGFHYVYLPNGVVSEERQFKEGKMHGPYKLYYDKNLIKTEGNYINGEMEGKNIFYYPNGVIAAEGTYKKGLKQGVWIYRENNGKVKEKELYKPGGILASQKEAEEYFNKNKVVETKTDTLKPKSTISTSKTTHPKSSHTSKQKP
jgi:antitoxin component YwqK of YwqJK toxin-antitoxin module